MSTTSYYDVLHDGGPLGGQQLRYRGEPSLRLPKNDGVYVGVYVRERMRSEDGVPLRQYRYRWEGASAAVATADSTTADSTTADSTTVATAGDVEPAQDLGDVSTRRTSSGAAVGAAPAKTARTSSKTTKG